jgi:hypothetical protein
MRATMKGNVRLFYNKNEKYYQSMFTASGGFVGIIARIKKMQYKFREASFT